MYKLIDKNSNLSLFVNNMNFNEEGLFQSFRLHYEPLYRSVAYCKTVSLLNGIGFSVWTDRGRLDFINN